MFIFYDLINLLLIILYLPAFLFKKKMHPGFSRRLGRYPAGLIFSDPVWIHAVSVGEMVNMRRLFQGLSAEFPAAQYVFSTVTPTGNSIAAKLARPQDAVTYLPLDLSFIVQRVLGRIRPRLFIIAETEFWPNLLSALHSRRVPVIIVNGRISDKAAKGYRLVRWVIAPLLRRISLFCMQSQRDADRVISLGARPDAVRVTGNMKYDQPVPAALQQDAGRKERLGIRPGEQCIVAGSTHRGEEMQVLRAFSLIARKNSRVRLIIVPRHPERSGEVESCVRRAGFEPVRVSRMTAPPVPERAVFIVDMIGELLSYYAIADAVFVGGSLIPHGGQNFLEPAFLDKPVIVGPSLFNFRDIARQFLDEKAAVLVRDCGELASAVEALLADGKQAAELVRAARSLIRRNAGATDRTLACIKEFVRAGQIMIQ
ncbi:MAG: 3-deoxy-D-manno-octulosonic acid transferase [Candidatus Omnitrophica bacterium]|nr:3-deoxy-D-manno-octulosonic acid transferase [Candidatus Omnitrophota bacterium]